MKILALDLGKFNTMCFFFDTRLSARRLWRPAMDDERWDSETIHIFDYRTQVAMWDGIDVCLPVVEWEPVERVCVEMYELAVEESRRFWSAVAGL